MGSSPQDEERNTCLASSSSFLHSFLHTRGLADRAAYGVVLGVVRHGLTGNAVLDPYCSCTHRIYVLEASSPTCALKVSCMGFLPMHGLHLSGRRRGARGLRNSLRHALGKGLPDFPLHCGESAVLEKTAFPETAMLIS